MDEATVEIETLPAPQQPDWAEPAQVARIRNTLAARPPLVSLDEVGTLRSELAVVARGNAHVVQAGDCAEDPADCTRGGVARKAALLELLAGTMKLRTHRPVVRAGRIAGQFAKPRSKPSEKVGGVELPVYRGHLVNDPEPDPESRQPDPLRLLTGYMAAGDIVASLGWGRDVPHAAGVAEAPIWTSHEALLLDYELPMLRRSADGRSYLASAHWPWIGDRTRHPDGAHVNLLARVSNPVACKVGPSMTADELRALCERLDPAREPGRLTLIARMGAATLDERLPSLVEAVRAAGHPAIWMADPMHANTVEAANGLKTRYLDAVIREVRAFQDVVEASGGVAGGLHLETTPDDVTECVANAAHDETVGHKYTSLCDPRLNPEQAVAVTEAWRY